MRRLVVPDIHGCAKTFRALVEKMALTKNDQLFLLGDYIDSGPNSSGVIDFIIYLTELGYTILPLRGNHEENMLRAYEEYDTPTFEFYVCKMKSSDLLTRTGEIAPRFLKFINELPFYYLLDDYILVHAGINFGISDPLDDKTALLELRNTQYDEAKAGGRKIIFGHQPHEIDDIHKAIASNSPLIPLDNGCVYNRPNKKYDHTRLGQLLCFDLDSHNLVEISNID